MMTVGRNDAGRMFYGRRKSDGAVFKYQLGNEVDFDFEPIDESTYEATVTRQHNAIREQMRAAWDEERAAKVNAVAGQLGVDPAALAELLNVPRG